VTPEASSTAAPAEVHDVVVVGAGPAGLACAATLLEHTALRVCLVDAGPGPGGQYWRHPAPASGPGALESAATSDLHHDLATYAELTGRIARGIDEGRAVISSNHHVWAVAAQDVGYVVHAVERSRPGRERAVSIAGRALVIATGAYDRSLPFPGWDLPGVMTAGGLQALLKAGDVLPGRRVALGGTGPFLLPVAAGLVRRGAKVVGVFEANRPSRWLRELRAVAGNLEKLSEGASHAKVLARHRVPVRTRRMIVAAHGSDRVQAISVARLDGAGRPVAGSVRRREVDAVGIGWGFTPQLDLAMTLGLDLRTDADGTPVVSVDRAQRTSRPRVYAAGETSGIGGAALAVAEGRLAAIGISADLYGEDQGQNRPWTKEMAELGAKVDRMRAFAAAMARAHPVPAGWADALDRDTIVCRCEEVRYAAVRAAIEQGGATDSRQVKQLTRAGMGWCQGRVCGYAAALLASGEPGDPVERLVSQPVPLGLVAESGSTPDAM
jgi:thioredoxin reductase/bacterioferritin-associated ferredoxin